MTQINLLEGDILGRRPFPVSRPAKKQYAEDFEKKVSPEFASESSGYSPPTAKDRRKQDEFIHREGASRKRSDVDATSSMYRGLSIGILFFLLLIAAGILVYFFYPEKIEDLTIFGPTAPEQIVLPESQDEIVEGEGAGETTDQPGQEQIVTGEKETYSWIIEKDESDILQTIQHGKKKLESGYQVLFQVNDRSYIRFFAISDDHLVLSAHTDSERFIDLIKSKIYATSIIKNLPLFELNTNPSSALKSFEMNVYANLDQPDVSIEKSGLQPVDLGASRSLLKYWLSVSEVQLLDWKTVQASPVDGWMRGLIYARLIGERKKIMDILQTIKRRSYNIGVSKIFYSGYRPGRQQKQRYSLQLYVTVYGKTSS